MGERKSIKELREMLTIEGRIDSEEEEITVGSTQCEEGED